MIENRQTDFLYDYNTIGISSNTAQTSGTLICGDCQGYLDTSEQTTEEETTEEETTEEESEGDSSPNS